MKKYHYPLYLSIFNLIVPLPVHTKDMLVLVLNALILFQYCLIVYFYPGPAWLSSSRDCGSLLFNGCCYFISQTRNWFDAFDLCRRSGSELARFDSKLDEKHVTDWFAEFLPFWIGYHGYKHKGTKFVWSDGSKDVYNKLDEKSLNQGLSAGLCTAVANSTRWERRNCSERLNALCRRPGELIFYFISSGLRSLKCILIH